MPSDAHEIAELESELFPENNFNETTLIHQLETGLAYLIYVDGQTAGYILVAKVGLPLIDILRLGVREPYRKAGLATVMLDNVLRLNKDTILTVMKDNTPAINLYKKHGFEIIGVMPQHNSWVMCRLTTTSS